MIWSFNILGQDKDIRGLFVDGSSNPRGDRSTCGSVIQVPRKEFHISALPPIAAITPFTQQSDRLASDHRPARVSCSPAVIPAMFANSH
jgi:hypothetical protein